ncbi:response regulator [Actinoplanes sp. CA-252034]|uniref:response regulator n=1 Tax=Actinoplanes sp. CA-252034 TaxID=3239906 RepID=UPI003D95FE91
MTIRVLIADDQELIRTALQTSVASAEDMLVLGEAGGGAEAVQLTVRLRPDVVMMDLRMAAMDGIEATRRITQGPTSAKVLVLTTFDDDDSVYGALRAGAAGFLVKDMAVHDILNAIRVVAAGDSLIAPSVTRRLINDVVRRSPTAPGPQRELTGITEREQQVLHLVGSGLSNTEIAARLSITVATAKSYVTRLLTKLGARDRVHLVIIAYEAGLVSAHR